MNKSDIKIIPAIMPRNLDDLEAKVTEVLDVVPIVQIDIMDGEFVGNRTWPYLPGKMNAEEEICESVFTHARFSSDFKAIIKEDAGLPFWDRIDYELDLMIANADESLEIWITTGAKRLIFHVESMPPERMLAMLEKLRIRFPRTQISDDNHESDFHTIFSLEIGIAINIQTPPEKIERFIEHIDFVQCMGIEEIGYQGEKLSGKVLDQIRTLREEYPSLILTIDGGVTEHNVGMLAMGGISRVVCGSAVFGASSPADAVFRIQEHFADSGQGQDTSVK
jgi:pentose-5-phosphate-3-epimerase